MRNPSESAAAPSVAAPVGAPIGSPSRTSPPRTKKRGAAAAQLASVAPRSDTADRFDKVDITGADKATLEGITNAKTTLDITKSIKALEFVADQSTVLSRELNATVLEHDSRLAVALQRIEVLERRAFDTDDSLGQVRTVQGQQQLPLDARLRAMVDQAISWEGELEQRLKVQNDDFQSKLSETAEMFRKCDGILAQPKAMKPVEGGTFATTAIPVAVGPASEPTTLLLVNEQIGLLRTRMDTTQASMKSLQ